jgi:CheY-like chemotaxis protein
MAKVVLVDADEDGRAALARALAGAGHEVTVSSSGAEALRVLACGAVDLVVSQAKLSDMDGCDLCRQARRDAPDSTRFLLLVAGDTDVSTAAAEAGVDLLCAGHVSVPTLLLRVSELLPAPPSQPGPRPGPPQVLQPVAATSGPRRRAWTDAAPSFEGSLGVMDLPALAQVIGMGGKTGHLELSLAVGCGVVEFDRGQPVHAEFAGGEGEEAFAALVWASQAEGGTFRFMPAPADAEPRPTRTIHRSVEGLLLDIAAWLDEERLPTDAPCHALDERG